MKYIPGYQFTAGQVAKRGGSLNELKAQQQKAQTVKDFIPGKVYKIYYIKYSKENVTYYFQTNEGVEQHIYSSIEEAENIIDKSTGVK